MENRKKIIFFGSTASSVLLLEELFTMKTISVVAVVTKKEKPSGRGQKVQENPVTRFLKNRFSVISSGRFVRGTNGERNREISPLSYNEISPLAFPKGAGSLGRNDKAIRTREIHLFQIEKLRDIEDELKGLKPTLFFVVDFGKIIPQSILDIPSQGAINFHPSLLPKYCGPSPIQTAILNGDTETGFSCMLLDAEIDHGPILYQERVDIDPADTSVSLEKKLFERGKEKIDQVVTQYLTGDLKPQEQDHKRTTVTKLIKKEDGMIDVSKETAETIEHKVRAYQPWPGVYFFLPNGKRIQILRARVLSSVTPHLSQDDKGMRILNEALNPKTNERWGVQKETKNKKTDLFSLFKKSFMVSCFMDTTLELLTVKPEGKKEMTGYDFWLGYQKELLKEPE